MAADGVDVGNLQRQERVAGVLDQLGGVDVGDDDRRFERSINLLHLRHGPFVEDADHDAVGVHQILDGATLAQKFGIADDVKIHFVFVVTADRLGHFLAGLDGHGRFIHDDLVLGHRARDLARHFLDETHVHRTIRLRRRRHGNENHFGFFDALGNLARETQPTCGDVLFDEFLQARFVNGNAALAGAARPSSGRCQRR